MKIEKVKKLIGNLHDNSHNSHKKFKARIKSWIILKKVFFFYPGFLSHTFTIHRTAGEKGCYL